MLIFRSINFFKLDRSFNLRHFTNLKYFQTNDYSLNDYLFEETMRRNLVLPTVEHVVFNCLPLIVICKAFPNLLHVELLIIDLQLFNMPGTLTAN